MSQFREAMQKGDEFVITCEHVPGRGLSGRKMDNILEFAGQVAASGGVHAISLTDNAGGNPAFSADILGHRLVAMGLDVIVHFSCKDMNRNAMEARAYALKQCGLTNLLVMSGDYPISGFLGIPKPVFDVDAVIALHYLKTISTGLDIAEGRKTRRLPGTEFYLGGTVSPFKWTEASGVAQYIKMENKIRAGAEFLVPQLGYDSRKHAELIRYVREHLGLKIPILGSVYVLSAGAGGFMNKGHVPGCFVSDDMLAILREESKNPDKGKGASLERAARQMAIMKGLGYNGAHIEGLHLTYEDVQHIVGRGTEIGDNWRDCFEELSFAPSLAGGDFFMFEGGDAPPAAEPASPPELRKTPKRAVWSPVYWLMRAFHRLFFTEGTWGYRMVRTMVEWSEKSKAASKGLAAGEHLVKRVLFDCRACDDCALFDTAYLCPESQCPKRMRIGPCGGAGPEGTCEVFEERKCLWERVYWRARNAGELEDWKKIGSPRNWALYSTSSWANYFLKRDRSGVELNIPAQSQKEK